MNLLCDYQHLPGAAGSFPRFPSSAAPFSLVLAFCPIRQHCSAYPVDIVAKNGVTIQSVVSACVWHRAFCSKEDSWFEPWLPPRECSFHSITDAYLLPSCTQSLHFSKIKHSIPPRTGLPDSLSFWPFCYRKIHFVTVSLKIRCPKRNKI